jgi:hypothetical protein
MNSGESHEVVMFQIALLSSLTPAFGHWLGRDGKKGASDDEER